MSVLENIVRLFAPHQCLGCGVEEDRLLCEACAESLPVVSSRCYRCLVATENYRVCERCRDATPLDGAIVYTPYSGLSKELVHHMKYERAQAGAHEAGRLLSHHAASHLANEEMLLVYIPTATSRVRARGYDHASLLARELSKHIHAPYERALTRVGQAHQVGSRRTERLRQLEGAFRVVRPESVRERRILLVDDVLTTGATLEQAAQMLKRAGAAEVTALVLCQA